MLLVIGQCHDFSSVPQLTFCQIHCFSHIKIKKYIKMGIIIFKVLIWEGILTYIRSEIMFFGCADDRCVAVKQNFRP